jgi:uncharacterized OB-fold protein
MRGLGADAQYWASLRQGKLQLQQCCGCSRWNWPAVYRCGACGSWEHRWVDVAPTGTVYSWTRTWHDFGAPRELALPFVSVLVELDGANHTRLLGVMSAAVTAVAIGQRVRGEIIAVTFNDAAIPVIQWQPAAPAGEQP